MAAAWQTPHLGAPLAAVILQLSAGCRKSPVPIPHWYPAKLHLVNTEYVDIHIHAYISDIQKPAIKQLDMKPVILVQYINTNKARQQHTRNQMYMTKHRTHI
jgi:hypothetical protein